MGFFDRLFGTEEQASTTPPAQRASRRTDDEIAVERYRYLLRTAPPETIEQVHTEAFSKLTEEQRDLLFQELSNGAPEGEAPRDTSARALASSATRQELRNPGTMERSLGGNGMGFGSMVASSLLGTVAGYVIGSALVGAFLPDPGSEASADGSAEPDASTDSSGGDASADPGGDYGGGDLGGGDFGGDFGGFDF
jgi:hypothetical protein